MSEYETETFSRSTLAEIARDSGAEGSAVDRAIRALDQAIVRAGETVRSDEPVNVNKDFELSPDGSVEFVGPADASGRRRELKVEEANLSDAQFAVTDGTAEAFARLDEPTAERLFIASTDNTGATLYETKALEEQVARIEGPDLEAVDQVVTAFASIGPDDIATLRERGTLDQWSEPAENREERQARRQTRDAARDAAEAAGIDLDEFDVAAAYGPDADPGTVVIQDKDTNQTRRIDPDEDLGDAIDQQTDGGSFEPTSSSSSNDATSPGTSVDDLGGGRLAAIAAIGAAILYGVTQS